MVNIKLSDEKINSLRNRIKDFIQKEDRDISDLHKIRTSSREILSLLNREKFHSHSIKKILKLSNKIRDIDVLLSEYFIRIPTQYKEKINIVFIRDILNKQREEKLKLFLEHLKILDIEIIQSKQSIQSKKPILSPQKNELHRYRIYIKKQLYISKNKNPIDKAKVLLLTKIKDMLGEINDNHNAIKIIKSIIQNKKQIKKLKRYTKEQNQEYYKVVQRFIMELEYKY